MKQVFFITVVLFGLLFVGSLFYPVDSNAGRREVTVEKLFKSKCSYCHGRLGVGSPTAPAFKGNGFIENAPAEAIKYVIVNGRKEAIKRDPKNKLVPMPPWGGKLTDKQIDELVVYLKTLY